MRLAGCMIPIQTAFNWDEPKPLKKRIEKDIFATLPEDLPFPRLAIRWAIAYYVGAPRYLDALFKIPTPL